MIKDSQIDLYISKRIKKRGFFNFLEVLIFFIIILALFQTFFEDFAIFLNLNDDIIFITKFSSFFFDLFFTIEFLIRLLSAIIKRRGISYITRENGWIDFIASIPLLLLISTPYMLEVFGTSAKIGFIWGGLSFLQNAKIIKIIRISRVLRFLRILKLTGKANQSNSYMTQRHLTKILTLSIITLTILFATVSILKNINVIPSSKVQTEKEENSFNEYFRKAENYVDPEHIEKNFRDIAEIYPSIVYLHYKNINFIRNELKDNQIGNEFDQAAIDKINRLQTGLYVISSPLPNMKIIYSRQAELKTEAANNLINFFIILILIIVILLFYSPHFNKTIAIPINEMIDGFEHRSNTAGVNIHNRYRYDEIFRLVSNYNIRWIRAKKRNISNKK